MSSPPRPSQSLPPGPLGIQGSAADVAKRAMLALHACLPPEDACLVNMVHDELLLEVREDRLQHVSRLGTACRAGRRRHPAWCGGTAGRGQM